MLYTLRATSLVTVFLASCSAPPAYESVLSGSENHAVGGQSGPCLDALDIKIPKVDADDWESVERMQDAFLQLVLTVAAKHPDSAQCEFLELAELGVNRVTSEDGRLSMFSWHTGLGGTMGHYRNVVQLADGQLIQCRTLSQYEGGEDVSDRYYTQLSRVGKTQEDDLYIGVSVCRLGGCLLGVTINAFRLEPTVIDDTLAVFMTADGSRSNDIGFVLEGCHEHDLSKLIDVSDDHVLVTAQDGQSQKTYRLTDGLFVESY
jgi:hypothetical protein